MLEESAIEDFSITKPFLPKLLLCRVSKWQKQHKGILMTCLPGENDERRMCWRLTGSLISHLWQRFVWQDVIMMLSHSSRSMFLLFHCMRKCALVALSSSSCLPWPSCLVASPEDYFAASARWFFFSAMLLENVSICVAIIQDANSPAPHFLNGIKYFFLATGRAVKLSLKSSKLETFHRNFWKEMGINRRV